ncbi:hypothetical protein BZA05DRAFT_386590 [Tricharina praecox]|uniref:uncharacterized protein n=1 Tax=Tricharina praecox TaxID=43433 RepID=UPI002220EA02|nr:uncharacterized protein BZA05DRAFT_386590 [Tricharina praecox]KAI5856916.1 hypothetical protein BZA05DRAFT_386590 [Tricharina praecox]
MFWIMLDPDYLHTYRWMVICVLCLCPLFRSVVHTYKLKSRPVPVRWDWHGSVYYRFEAGAGAGQRNWRVVWRVVWNVCIL